MNGKLILQSNRMFSPVNIQRNFSYFGKGTYDTDPYANAILDEIKIFNRSLSSDQVLFEHSLRSPNSKLFPVIT